MTMRTNAPKLLAVLLCCCAQLAACGADEREEMRGFLFFVVGNYLAQLDLRDGSTSVVTNVGDAEIQSLSPQLDNRLLLTVYGSENQRDMHRLVLYDIETHQMLTLLNGREGYYLPGTKTLVFDDGVGIYLTERVMGSWERTEVVEHRFNERVEIMPVSAQRFAYRVADGPLVLYDKTVGRSMELSGLDTTCDLERALWFTAREQMLCKLRRNESEYEYAFVTLDGDVQEALSLPGDRDFKPVAWVPDQDVLVLTEQWSTWFTERQRSAVWIYSFATGEAYRFIEDQYLGDTVIYRGN